MFRVGLQRLIEARSVDNSDFLAVYLPKESSYLVSCLVGAGMDAGTGLEDLSLHLVADEYRAEQQAVGKSALTGSSLANDSHRDYVVPFDRRLGNELRLVWHGCVDHLLGLVRVDDVLAHNVNYRGNLLLLRFCNGLKTTHLQIN